MAINIKFQIGKVDDLPATAEITMSVGEWKYLRDLQQSAYPASKLTSAINDVIMQMEKVHLHFGGASDHG